MSNTINKLDKLGNTIQLPLLTKVGDAVKWSIEVCEEIKKVFTKTNFKVNNHVWQLTQWVDIDANADNITFSQLNGDTDIEYMIVCRIISKAGANACQYSIQPNGIATGTKYGYQYIYASNTTHGSARVTASDVGLSLGTNNASDRIMFSKTMFFAKSGYIRTALTEIMEDVTGTTVTTISSTHSVWNDTSTNVTSLKIVGSFANGLGIGSRIEIWIR